jgi:hypothetical protein
MHFPSGATENLTKKYMSNSYVMHVARITVLKCAPRLTKIISLRSTVYIP